MEYWERPQGAAIFKHAVLKRYVPLFASKTGSTSIGSRVELLDGYAGQGWYEDGSPASPAYLIEAARQLAARRSIRCWFVEERRTSFDALCAGLHQSACDPGTTRALYGRLGDHLPEILGASEGVPLFAFVDPFGMGLPFDQLVRDLMGRSRRTPGKRVPTEVLLNFIYAGVYRNAGMLDLASSSTTQRKAAATKVAQLDASLGGSWWHSIQRAHGGTPELVHRIRDEFIRRVLAAAGPNWSCFQVAVSDDPAHKPIYELMLFTQHAQGIWYFNEAVSLARQVFQTHCEDGLGILQRPLWEPDDEWTATIASNLLRLLGAGRPVRVIDNVDATYGTLLGVARGTHVKAAAKRLAADGHSLGDTNGEAHQLILRPSVDTAARSA